ncbi:hypothetical protein [Bacillus sp. FJAT-27245]|uniref:hypothetical protein n=1 Tax=Bacillus sp. FJAT-27245 TaxID=1684144 RepID=UPI0006A75CB9|nr:hypothetical protein [Bacillus sp. FJAT-27245]
MFVKVYEYHIQPDKIDEYLSIQKKASEMYSKFVDVQTIYLQSKVDHTKWLEISTYTNESEYTKAMSLLNEQKEIMELFEKFTSLQVEGMKNIKEEDFTYVKISGQ